MFPIVKARLLDRDLTLLKEVELPRWWGAPPKVLIENKVDYYLRISDDETLDPVVYRRTKAVRHIC